jgi:hypothetical protein
VPIVDDQMIDEATNKVAQEIVSNATAAGVF